ncbi:MAG: response regulator [Leptolyngbyaceae cyanobacterium SL_7_1]|nr:response regulator [Leptolyngbyaceae cyanobacterium SL_7_1]
MTKRILVIDDERDLRDIIQLSLEGFTDWETDGAGSGQEGLDKARTNPFDAILLDVSMPDMDGLQVFKQLQSHASTCSIPVVLLTAKTLPSDRHQFIGMGVTGLIGKPFDPTLIAKQVAEILGWTM